MKVFETGGDWNKLNVVDENNVLVGYSFEQSCCESYGYYFTDKEPEICPEEFPSEDDFKFEHEKFVFDTSFFKEIKTPGHDDDRDGAVFRLVNGDESVYLVLWNYHNGYYSHGFEMKVGEKIIHEGSL